jgi:MoaA/NifB/PqqE/SkfB family radical SAM enzyme
MAVGSITFHLTDRCHLDCLHCLRDPAKKPLDLTPELVERVLAQAVAAYGCCHAGLTGGEPVLHPRLGEVLDGIVRQGCSWHLVTSGGRFARLMDLLAEDPRRRDALTAVNLSLDGPREEVHDAIRGPGAFREVMAAAARCQAEGLRFTFQIALHAGNAAVVEELGLVAAQLGAASLMFAVTQPTGTPRDAALFLPPAQVRGLRDRIERLAEHLKLPVGMAEGFPEKGRFHVCAPQRSETLHVDPHGRLSLCCQLSGVPGEERDVVADLSVTGLVEGHRKVLELIREEQDRRLVALGPGSGAPGDAPGEWDAFPCNRCLASFGKPHWTETGAAGPQARRERFGTAVHWRAPGLASGSDRP